MPRYVNLIFQGGGVKGLTYAGALSAIPPDVCPRVVGGTSAGAIAAALLAVGMGQRELHQTLHALDLETLLDPADLNRLKEIRNLLCEARALFADQPSTFALGRFLLTRRKAIWKHLQQLFRQYGLFATDGLHQWLNEIIGPKTFKDITVEDLRIVGSSLDKRELRAYTKEDRNVRIVDAVVASASIPFFFTPSRLDGHMVDGGMLSNFPVLLFQREPYPTVGFRLHPLVAPTPQIGQFGQFLRALTETSLDAHDRIQRRPDHYHEEAIFFPSSITPIDFNLTDDQKLTLFQLGERAGRRVPWERFASATPLIHGLDPSPDKVLTRVLENSSRLAEAYNSEALRPEELEDDNTFCVRVDRDGTVHYAIKQTVTVRGKRPWLGASQKLIFASLDAIAGLSLVDLQWTMKEGAEDLPRFPLENSLTKGFVFCFSPPVAAGDPKRTFDFSWQMPKEFARTLCAGGSDTLSFAVTPRADKHRFRLTFELMLHCNLGEITLRGLEGMKRLNQQHTVVEMQRYMHYHWATDWTQVTASCVYELNLQRRS